MKIYSTFKCIILITFLDIFLFLWLKNIIILNYKRFLKKVKQPLSTHVSTCLETSISLRMLLVTKKVSRTIPLQVYAFCWTEAHWILIFLGHLTKKLEVGTNLGEVSHVTEIISEWWGYLSMYVHLDHFSSELISNFEENINK